MSRSSKARRRNEPEDGAGGFELNPETKRGIVVVVLFALSALLFLSFFSIAGVVGTVLDSGMAQFLGFDRFLIPVLLILIGASIYFPERAMFGAWNYVGLLFFFLSFNGIVNLFAFKETPATPETLASAGGILGQFLATILPNIVGFWASLLILASLLLVSILLTFNTSLRNVMGLHRHVTGWFGELMHRRPQPYHRAEETEEEGVEEEEDEETEEEVEEEEEEIEEEEPKEAFRAKPLKSPTISPPTEKVLTAKVVRKAAMPMDLLEYRTAKANSGDIERNREIIRRTFEQFNIPVEMSDVAVGPTVAQYALKPAEGIKLSRIVGLQNDLALALAAHPIRIEAPIPGKSLVGIEVPNQSVATVALRELIESKAFKTREGNLAIALGKDVSGKVWTPRLDKMPHMLVAGATGSGKSVCLNTIIVALLYENGPDELKFVMVDPKRVELTAYEGIPHLLVPPIIKVDDTVNALKWTVREMERRLDVLSKFGVRDIASYNSKVEEKMPRIVVVIDELADLMSSSGHEVEATIVRIAQMARAVGIHLILATQRPSVDVITGTIKANFPARIAFAVASQTDSRTILDCAGAEKLLGRGDMLYTSAELSKPVRLQGAYVSESEVERVVQHLKKEGVPDYNYAVTQIERSGTMLDGGGETDPLLDEAAQVVIQNGRASTSLLQRRLKVGYGRAARILDILEQNGVVGPPEGSKPREVLVEEWPPAGSDEEEPVVEEEVEETEEIETEETEAEPAETPATEEEGEEDSAEDEEETEEEGEEDEEDEEPEEEPTKGDEDEYLEAQEGEYLDEPTTKKT